MAALSVYRRRRDLDVLLVVAALTAGLIGAGFAVSSASRLHGWGASAELRASQGARRDAQSSSSLVALGDSVATGHVCGCAPYPVLVAGDLDHEGDVGRVVNAAADGQTTSGLLGQLDDTRLQAALAGSTLVTVTTGANDFAESRAGDARCSAPALSCYQPALQALPGRLTAALTRIRQLAPDARLVVTGYWNVFQDGDVGDARGPAAVAASRALTAEVDRIVEHAAEQQQATYVDLRAAFDASSQPVTGLLASDGDHPNVVGTKVIADAVMTQIAPAAR